MGKKNIVLLVIDSLSAKELNDEIYGETAMPFLKSLIKKGICLENFYSQGPHTEAGLRGLLCGIDTMDDNAYMHRFSDHHQMIFDIFLNAGYQALTISWPGNYLPERLSGRVKEYYTQGVDFSGMLFWRLPYFYKLYHQDSFTKKDLDDMVWSYQDAFRVCIEFLDKEKKPAYAYELTKKRVEKVDFVSVKKQLEEEQRIFYKNPKEYVMQDIRTGHLKERLGRTCFDSENEIDRACLKGLEVKYGLFLKRMKQKQIVQGFSDIRTDYVKLAKHAMYYFLKKDHWYLGDWHNKIKSRTVFSISEINRADDDSTSFKKQLQFLVERLEEQKKKQPCFVYLHTNCLHYPTEWFSFDETEEVIEKEIREAQRLIRNTHHYHGSYGYRMGMRYVDNCIKGVFREMEKRDLLKDTLFVITADHGTSMGSAPIRNGAAFNNCHSELFHIPLIIYGKGIVPKKITGFYENKDMLPSLLELCDIERPEGLSGHSFFDHKYTAEIAHAERIGSGCPSLEHRDVIYTARNKKYLIEYNVSVYKKFEDGVLVEAYDLENDQNEVHNLAKKIKKEEIADLLQFLKKRHLELQKNYKNFLLKGRAEERKG